MSLISILHKKNTLTNDQKKLLNIISCLGEPVFISINKLSTICGISEIIVENTLHELIRENYINFERTPFGNDCDLIKILIKKPRKNIFFNNWSVLRFLG